MTRNRSTFVPLSDARPKLPPPPSTKDRLATLDRLGAPYFHGLPCPACGAEFNEFCTNPGRGLFAHQKRIDAAFRIAYSTKGA